MVEEVRSAMDGVFSKNALRFASVDAVLARFRQWRETYGEEYEQWRGFTVATTTPTAGSPSPSSWACWSCPRCCGSTRWS